LHDKFYGQYWAIAQAPILASGRISTGISAIEKISQLMRYAVTISSNGAFFINKNREVDAGNGALALAGIIC
jgi:hypothetical protein